MDVFALTRKLIDIESTTGQEAAVAEVLADELTQLGYDVERMTVEGDRFNLWATHPGHPRPELVLSTHMDTVPPFVPSSETADRIYGRGSCDAKGIIVAQIAAAEKLKAEYIHVGLLFLVGEERDSQGAQTANQQPRGAKFLINGEPTENKLAVASKGTLRVELVARGKMAHSAYPELGESAIEKLLDALDECSQARSAEQSQGRPVHHEHRSYRRRPRAQRHPRPRARAFALSTGRASARVTPTNHECGCRQSRSRIQT